MRRRHDRHVLLALVAASLCAVDAVGESRTKLTADGKPSYAWWLSSTADPPPRENQHPFTLKGMYLALLLRGLTGGLNEPGSPEPFLAAAPGTIGPMERSNRGCAYLKDATCLLDWDGYQRAIETGRVLDRVLDAGVQGAVAEVGGASPASPARGY